MQRLLQEQPDLNLSEACQVLKVSRSGFYAHRRKPLGKRRTQDAALATEVRQTFVDNRCTYGSPRIMHALRHKGLRHGKNRIARLMRQENCQVQQKRRFVPRTTVVDKDSPVAPNHLKARDPVQQINEVWLTDITYVPTAEGWLYLAAEMDACSRRIIGWSTGYSLDTALPLQALERALRSRDYRAKDSQLMHHSDRGCQYTSASFRKHLTLRGITQSMSRAANCYDNATMESFWASLKAECFGGGVALTRAQAHHMIFDYIETFYNPVRLHSALGFLSPVDFERALQQN